MASKDLLFRLFGEDVNASESMRRVAVSADESSKGIHKAFGDTPKIMTEVAAGAVAASVALAASFQTASARLVTDAGESARNLGKVRTGMLNISEQTGLTAKTVATGMYTIESAGFHGEAGLKVLAAASEGAAIGGADLKTVADALTTTMTDYSIPAGKAKDTTSKLIETVSLGKTTMEDLAGSLHNVLPGAESAHIGLSQVLGAMATMTGEGISADQASQNLNHAILSLQNPTQVQAKALAAMGLSSIDVAKNLGKKGLTGTYEQLSAAITAHMGKDGLVVQNAFNQSKQAAASADEMLTKMPKSIRGVANEYMAGTVTAKTWTADVKAQTPIHAALLKQFAATAASAHGFSDALKSGQGPFGTYAAELSKMTGGQVGLQVALHLSGIHSATFEHNATAIGHASTEAGGHVQGWAETQQNFTQRLKEAGQQIADTGIVIGSKLLPGLTNAVRGFSSFFTSLTHGQPAAVALASAVGIFTAAMVGLFVAMKTYEVITGGAKAIAFTFGAAQAFVAGWTTAAAGATDGAATAQKGYAVATKAGAIAQGIFNAVMDANPVALIVIAIAALIAIVILLVTHWKQVCAFIQNVWGAVAAWWHDSITAIGTVVNSVFTRIGSFISGVVSTVVGFVREHWQLLLAIFLGPLGLVIDFIATNFAAIKQVIANVIGFVLNIVKTDIGAVRNVISTVVGWISKFWATEVHGWQIVIEAVWKFIRPFVTTEINIIRTVVTSVMNTISGTWKTVWGGISSFLAGVWKAIVGAVSAAIGGVIGFFQPLASKIIGAIGNAGTLLLDTGKHIVQGLINGITGMASNALGAIGGLAGNVIKTANHVFGVKSPSTVFRAIGTFLTTGLQQGIAGGADKVKSTMASLASKVTTAFNTLADQRTTAQARLKTLDTEYSNALKDAPKLVVDSTGKISAARKAAYEQDLKVHNQRLSLLRGEMTDEQSTLTSITKASSAKSTLTTLLTRDNAQLTKLATARDTIASQLSDAQDSLKTAMTAWSDEETQVSGDAVGLGSVITSYTAIAQQHSDAVSSIADLQSQLANLDPTSDSYSTDQASLQSQLTAQNTIAASTSSSTGGMISSLQNALTQTKQFSGDLKTLLGMGLDPTTYQQLVSAGIGGGGLAAAEDLINSGAGSVAQIASLQSQLQSASDSLGGGVADQMFGAGVQAAQGVVNGLSSQQAAVQAAMTSMANTMTQTLITKLDIHSPSRVFEQHGLNVGAGLAKGIRSSYGDVAASVNGMVTLNRPLATAPGSTGIPGVAASSATAGGKPLVHIDNFHATPTQSPADIASELGWLVRSGV